MIYNYLWGRYLCLVGILFNLLDYVTTFIGVMLLGLIELNPIVNWTLSLGGLGLLTLIKIGLVTLIFMMFYNHLGCADYKYLLRRKVAYVGVLLLNSVLISGVVFNCLALYQVVI